VSVIQRRDPVCAEALRQDDHAGVGAAEGASAYRSTSSAMRLQSVSSR
jgi:hypothetical protein